MFLIMQTDLSEAFDYLKSKTSFQVLISLFFYVFGTIYVSLYFRKFLFESRFSRKIVLLLTVCFLIFVFFLIRLLPESHFYQEIKAANSLYEQYRSRRQVNLDDLTVLKTNTEEDIHSHKYLIVIGESSNRDHWGLYGYNRQTTPRLERIFAHCRRCAYISKAYSTEKMTETSLAKALTNMVQDSVDFRQSISIVDIFNKAEFDTYWFSNQNVWGNEKSSFNSIASTCKHNVFYRPYKYSYFDERPLDIEIVRMFEATDFPKGKDIVVFLHLMGSHAPYDTRYSKDLAHYKSTGVNSINAYDNSILYTDYILDRLYSIAKDKNFSGLFYFSDHGELPGVGRDSLNVEMFKIPAIYFSFEKNAAADLFIKESKSGKIFTLDMLFSTIQNLFGVKSNRYRSAYDYVSNVSILNSAKIMDGTYTIVYDHDLVRTVPTLITNRSYTSRNNTLEFKQSLSDGWCPLESWGVWSCHTTASVNFTKEKNASKVFLNLVPLLGQMKHANKVTLYLNSLKYADYTLTGPQRISVDLTQAQNSKSIVIMIESEVLSSPKSLGINEDTRTLGVGLTGISVE